MHRWMWLSVIVLAIPPLQASQESSTPFQRVAGTWDWVGVKGSCRDNPHTISFEAADKPTMVLKYVKLVTGPDEQAFQEARYELRGWNENVIRIFLISPAETRKTDDGQLVVWDLVLVGRDRYKWHRADWKPDVFTREIRRCK